MRKTLVVIIVLAILIGTLSIGVYAATPNFSLSGPGTIRAGNNIRVTVNLNGSNLMAAMGEITFDTSQLVYNSTSDNLAGWAIDIEQSAGVITFLAIDDKLEAPINSNKTLFNINFTVRSSVTSSDTIRVATRNLEVSDGTNDFNPSNVSYQRDVSPPLSSNNNLGTLSVSNAEIAPSFSSGTTSYSTTVPFTVTSLNISASTSDASSSYSISGNTLQVGTNTVTITVTAANGSQRNYTINVTREQDPNYIASDNSKLSSINPDLGILSPVFDPDVFIYYVYLPYEIEKFNALGQAQDEKATGVESEEISLEVGENEFIITCIAEDGSTSKYQINVVRMPLQEQDDETITPINEESTAPFEKFILTGRLIDSENNPMRNMLLELHSNPMVTATDMNGYFVFNNVPFGEHTLFIKDGNGLEISRMPLVLKYGNETKLSADSLSISGDTIIEIFLTQTGMQIKNVQNYDSNYFKSGNSQNTFPWWGILLIALACLGIGFFAGYILFKNKWHIVNEDELE